MQGISQPGNTRRPPTSKSTWTSLGLGEELCAHSLNGCPEPRLVEELEDERQFSVVRVIQPRPGMGTSVMSCDI